MVMAEVHDDPHVEPPQISVGQANIIDIESPHIAALYNTKYKKDIVENYFNKSGPREPITIKEDELSSEDVPSSTRFRSASMTNHPLSLPTDEIHKKSKENHVEIVEQSTPVSVPVISSNISLEDLNLTQSSNISAESSEYVRNFFQLPETEELLEGLI
jgi:hypothetical protein